MPELSLSPQAFREVSRNYATGIAVVTTLVGGEHHAMTANSFTTVSLDPLLVMVCAQHGTRFHEAVIASGHWAASFLSAQQVPVARWFATPGRPLKHQFAGIPTLVTSRGALILRDALAAVAATTEQVVPAGDHDILISQVTSLHLSRTDLEPTVYFRSAYGSWSLASADTPTI